METLLKVDDLSVSFQTDDGLVNVLNKIHFEVKEREIVGVVGESGCGKSMMSLALMRMIPKPGKIVGGSIQFEGNEMTTLTEKEYRSLRGSKISMIFQDPSKALNPVYTVGDQILETIQEHMAVSKQEAKKKTLEILEKVGIPNPNRVFRAYPHELSGGMKQRIMIATALVCSPKLLIADEPTTALDVTIQAQILELMREMRNVIDTSIILITHDLGVLAEMCDRVVVMYAGEVIEENNVYDLFASPKHPYTKGLFDSIPRMDEDKEELHYIPGQVPMAGKFPVGCRFAPRCSRAFDKCETAAPGTFDMTGGKVKCWLYETQ